MSLLIEITPTGREKSISSIRDISEITGCGLLEAKNFFDRAKLYNKPVEFPASQCGNGVRQRAQRYCGPHLTLIVELPSEEAVVVALKKFLTVCRVRPLRS